MEDVVPEAGSMLHPVNLGPDGVIDEGEIHVRGSDEEKPDHGEVDKQAAAKEGKDEGKEGGGLLESLISNLVSPKVVSETSERKADAFQEGNKMITKEDEGFRSSEEEAAGGGGGIIKNIISNLFHRGEDNHEDGRENQKEEQEEVAKSANNNNDKEAAKTEEHGGGGGGGGIIESIVSNLPSSFPVVPDDAAPTSDEATILINSIVRD